MGRKKKRKFNDRHAESRLLTRYNFTIDIRELRDAVARDQYRSLKRLTASRTLCSVEIEETEVYFVLNRGTKSIVTVLDPVQARRRLEMEK